VEKLVEKNEQLRGGGKETRYYDQSKKIAPSGSSPLEKTIFSMQGNDVLLKCQSQILFNIREIGY
jgi:hypothetical protein